MEKSQLVSAMSLIAAFSGPAVSRSDTFKIVHNDGSVTYGENENTKHRDWHMIQRYRDGHTEQRGNVGSGNDITSVVIKYVLSDDDVLTVVHNGRTVTLDAGETAPSGFNLKAYLTGEPVGEPKLEAKGRPQSQSDRTPADQIRVNKSAAFVSSEDDHREIDQTSGPIDHPDVDVGPAEDFRVVPEPIPTSPNIDIGNGDQGPEAN